MSNDFGAGAWRQNQLQSIARSEAGIARHEGLMQGREEGLATGLHNGKADQWETDKDIIGSLMNHLHARTVQRDVLLQEIKAMHPYHPYVNTEISEHPELVAIMQKNREALAAEVELRTGSNPALALLEAAGASITTITKGEEAMAKDGAAVIATTGQGGIPKALDDAIYQYHPFPPYVVAAEQFPNYLWQVLQKAFEVPEEFNASLLQKVFSIGKSPKMYNGPITDGLGETLAEREANCKAAAAHLLETCGGPHLLDELNALMQAGQQPKSSWEWTKKYADERVAAYVDEMKRKYKGEAGCAGTCRVEEDHATATTTPFSFVK